MRRSGSGRGSVGLPVQDARLASTPEIDIWYDGIDVGRLLEHFAPDAALRAGKMIETKAQRRTSRGASRKLTETVDGHRRIRSRPASFNEIIYRALLSGFQEPPTALIETTTAR